MTETKDVIVIDGITYKKVDGDDKDTDLNKRLGEIYDVDYVRNTTDSDDDPITHVEFTNGADIEFAIERDESTVNITIGGWSFEEDSIRALIKVLELIRGEIV